MGYINKLDTICKTPSVKKGSLIVMGLLIAISYCLSPYNVELDPDATCYMGVTRLLCNGQIPIVDFKIDYTPLVMYLMMLPVSLFGASYPVGMITAYIVQLFDALLVVSLAKKAHLSQLRSFFCGLYFLLCCLFLGGRQFFLEPFVLFFGLSSLWLLHYNRSYTSLLAGICCFCAFWCKQYGLGFLPLALLFIIFDKTVFSLIIKKSLFFISGFIIGMICSIGYWISLGISVSQIVDALSTKYNVAGISGLVETLQSFSLFYPLFFFVLIFVLFRPSIILKHRILPVCICGVLGFMLQGWIRYNYHYLMLVIPFAILSIVYFGTELHYRLIRRIYHISLVLCTFIPIFICIRKDIVIFTSGKRVQREACAAAVAKLVPPGSSNVFTSINMLSLTLQNNYFPPCLKEHGMSNGFLIDPKDSFYLLKSASYCLIAKEDWENDDLFPDRMKSFLFDNFQITEVDVEGTYSDCFVFIPLS